MTDPLYLGLRQPRVRGKEYDAFIQKFLLACRKRFPKAYIHFEDFGLSNARRILDQYSPQFACFNDDVQGTGAVTLAALYAALQAAKTPMQDIRVVILGAGTAGIGIADQIRDAIATERNKSREEASRQIWTVDKHGIVLEGQEGLNEAQRAYARPESEWPKTSFLDVIKAVKPHVLIGTSTKPRVCVVGSNNVLMEIGRPEHLLTLIARRPSQKRLYERWHVTSTSLSSFHCQILLAYTRRYRVT